MNIFNFRQFINEKQGVSLPSIIFADFLENWIYNTFLEFLESDEKSVYDLDDIKYGLLKTYIKDIKLYSEFPVVGFEVIKDFKKTKSRIFKSKYKESDKMAVGGEASYFGNKNWGAYSKIVKPKKEVTDIGLIIQIRINIEVDSDNFDTDDKDQLKTLRDQIGSVIYHELNHSYEHYKRTTQKLKTGEFKKPIYNRSFNTAITYSDENTLNFPNKIWDLWDRFLNYIYLIEKYEMNANIQETYYMLKKYPDLDLDELDTYREVNEMLDFKSSIFYSKLIKTISETDNWEKCVYGVEFKNEEELANMLKDMWVDNYKSKLEGDSPIISINTFKKMSCLDFIKFWEDRILKSADYMKRKILKMKNSIDNEKI